MYVRIQLAISSWKQGKTSYSPSEVLNLKHDRYQLSEYGHEESSVWEGITFVNVTDLSVVDLVKSRGYHDRILAEFYLPSPNSSHFMISCSFTCSRWTAAWIFIHLIFTFVSSLDFVSTFLLEIRQKERPYDNNRKFWRQSKQGAFES